MTMNLQDILLKRRDTRHFTKAPVPDEVLQKALSAAHLAPSVGMSEAVRFYVIRETAVKQNIYDLFVNENERIKAALAADEETLKKYSPIKLQAILEAPVGMVITTDYSVLQRFTIGVSGTAETLQWSSVCAVQNMWLSLTEQGYSLGWVSILNYHRLKQLLQLPAHEFPLGYFCIGQPATDYDQQPMLQQIGWKEKAAMPAVKEITQVVPLQYEQSLNIPAQTGVSSLHENTRLKEALTERINNKTKPVGALGRLEEIAWQVGMIQQTVSPAIHQPHIVIFAADHGIAGTGLVNPYPQAVTAQMVRNFLQEGAAINVFCKQHRLALTVVDAGVNHVWKPEEIRSQQFINLKMGYGTANYLSQPAMTTTDALLAIEKGKKVLQQLQVEGCNCVGFGEMGIGNTSSATLIMSTITGLPVKACTGRGTGVSDEQLQRKVAVLEKAHALHELPLFAKKPIDLLAKVGGFEIAMMTGAYLQAHAAQMVILVDGFISTAALLIAYQLEPAVLNNCIFAHTSGEQGHEKMLQYLHARPLLNLGLRLGEGTGAALAIPLVQSAVHFLREMASFESAGVETKHEGPGA